MDIPLDLLGTFIFTTLLSFMTGMAKDSVSTWGYTYLVLALLTFVGNAIGNWASVAAPAKIPELGLFLTLVVMLPQFLFAGILINLDQIPSWWKWMRDISIFRYAFELLMQAWEGDRSAVQFRPSQ